MSDYSKQRKHWPLVLRYHQDFPDLSHTDLATKILEEEQLDLKAGHFKAVVGACRSALSDGVITEKYEHSKRIAPKWEVQKGMYIIRARRGNIHLSVEEIDNLFYEHTRHGLDYTSTRVMNMHNLKPWQWHAIKSALRLYKDDNIFSPWTVENTDPKDLEAMMEAKMNHKFDDKQRLIELTYDKVQRKEYNKVIDEHHKRTLSFQKMIEEVFETVEKLPDLTLVRTHEADDEQDPQEILVTIADLHIGAYVRGLKATNNFDIEVVRDRLDQIASRCNQLGAQRIHLAFLGDLIESFTGLTHPNSWKSMEHGMYGAKVIDAALDLIIEFLGKIHNVAGIYCVGGNHDRATSSWAEDDEGDIAGVIWKMLQRLYGNQIDVVYDPLVISKQIDGVNYLLTHGDKKAVSRNPAQFVLEYGNTDAYTILLSGHLHTRMIPEDNSRFRWILSPSVFSGNWYSEKNGWTAAPGFLAICNDLEQGMPVVVDYPLK